MTLTFLGLYSLRVGEYDAAARFTKASLADSELIGDLPMSASNLRVSAMIALYQGDYHYAQTLLDRALELTIEANLSKYVCHALLYQGEVAVALREYEQARERYEEALAIAVENGDRLSEAGIHNGMGTLALALGELEKAREEYETSLALSRRIGRRRDAAIALTGLGNVALALNDYEVAGRNFGEALQTAMEIRAVPEVLNVLVGIAQIQSRAGAATQATSLLRRVLAHPACTQQTRERATQMLSVLNVGALTIVGGKEVLQLQSLEHLLAELDLSI
jgi:tetratricopeptide (TPR) repeat protein